MSKKPDDIQNLIDANLGQLPKNSKGAHFDPDNKCNQELMRSINDKLQENGKILQERALVHKQEIKEEMIEGKHQLEVKTDLELITSKLADACKILELVLRPHEIVRLTSKDSTKFLFRGNNMPFSLTHILDKHQTNALGIVLSFNHNITSLELFSWNQDGSEAIIALSDILKNNRILTSLKLCGTEMGNKGAEAIAEALMSNQTITVLDLQSNRLSQNDVKTFASMLRINNTLKSLTFQEITDDNFGRWSGVKLLAEAIETNQSLTCLDLQNNNIRTMGAVALSKMLESNRILASLILSGNSSSDIIRSCAKALGENKTLTSLVLSVDPSFRDVLNELSDILKRNTGLRRFDLSNASIGDDQVTILSEGLKTNKALTSLDLTHNPIGNEGAIALADMLEVNQTLTTLQLSFDGSINQEIHERIEALTKQNQHTQAAESISRANWIRISPLLAFERANASSSLKDSVLALIPGIVKLIEKDEFKPKTSKPKDVKKSLLSQYCLVSLSGFIGTRFFQNEVRMDEANDCVNKVTTLQKKS